VLGEIMFNVQKEKEREREIGERWARNEKTIQTILSRN